MGQQSRSSLEQVCQLNVEVLGEPGGCAGGGGWRRPELRSRGAVLPRRPSLSRRGLRSIWSFLVALEEAVSVA